MISLIYQINQYEIWERRNREHMEAKIQISGKSIAKVVGAACLATGVIALGALVASTAAVGAVAGSFKSAGNIVKEVLKKEEKEDAADATFIEEDAADESEAQVTD